MLTTKFRVWLQDPGTPPVWAGVKLVDAPHHIKTGCIELAVKGNGSDRRELIAKRRDIFAAYLQMKPEKRKEKREAKREIRLRLIINDPSIVAKTT